MKTTQLRREIRQLLKGSEDRGVLFDLAVLNSGLSSDAFREFERMEREDRDRTYNWIQRVAEPVREV